MKLHFVNKYSSNPKEHTFALDDTEDFQKIVDRFPQLEDSLYSNNDLRMIAKSMASYLNRHHIRAWISE